MIILLTFCSQVCPLICVSHKPHVDVCSQGPVPWSVCFSMATSWPPVSGLIVITTDFTSHILTSSGLTVISADFSHQSHLVLQCSFCDRYTSGDNILTFSILSLISRAADFTKITCWLLTLYWFHQSFLDFLFSSERSFYLFLFHPSHFRGSFHPT